MWDLVRNPEDRFSHNEAHIINKVRPSVAMQPLVVVAVPVAGWKSKVSYGTARPVQTMQNLIRLPLKTMF